MSYTLDQLAVDCRAALDADDGPDGRINVRDCIARACNDAEFVATHLGPDNSTERKVIYEDDKHGFCILAHVYSGAKASGPHDHETTWAIYGQASGVTEMTDWRLIEAPDGDKPGKVEPAKVYQLTPGDAYVYHVGDLHSPKRTGETRLIRVEGRNLWGVKRAAFVPV